MKMQHRLYYIISLFMFLMWSTASFSQEETKIDTLALKENYGLRLGGDASKLIRSFVDKDYKGFEVNGDYRLTKKIYIAGELGIEERNIITDYLNTTTSGSYFKAGIDINLYKNWLDMENMIYSGFRVGVSSFSHTLNSYTVYNTDQYWNDPYTQTQSREFNGLSAIWAELIIGIKAEVLNNVYVGLNAQLKGMVSQDEPTNFENLYVPGFNKTYDSGRFGVGFGYSVSYLIPIYKKDKKVKTEESISD